MDEALYVRVEGVNLVNFVEDVHDLSTIRGGSFLLLEAVDRVQQKFQLQAISSGASSGLFVAAEGDVETLRGDIEAFLHNDRQLRHATFVVDVVRGDFSTARNSLLAMNRWRQFQQPTLAVPSRPKEPARNECAFDHVRPATEWVKKGDEEKRQPASSSVWERRQFGRDRKTSFYEQELRKLKEPALDELIGRVAASGFVLDLEALADDDNQGSLDAKIAVIYFDGNKFGSMQKKCDRSALTLFDQTVKRYRQTALSLLLTQIFEQPDGWWTSDEEVRLETLLWGGDELLWVVPAWKGWDVVRLFYDVSSTWTFGKTPLTHAGGIVFCHRAAPIHRMTNIAKKLAESCKSGEMPGTHAEGDLFAYQVLESFDEIGPDFDDFRKHRLPGVAPDDLVVRASGMGGTAPHFDAVRRHFPRSKLHDIVTALRDGGDAAKVIESTHAELPDPGRDALKELFRFFGRGGPMEGDAWLADRAAWLHLAELWDYAVPGDGRRP